MIWGALSSAGVGSLCFLKTNVTAPVYQDILEHFMLPSADQLFKDADFLFQEDSAPAHTAKSSVPYLPYLTHQIQLISSLVETAKTELGVRLGRHTKCAGQGVLQDRFGKHWSRGK